jgi:hypothetical protein
MIMVSVIVMVLFFGAGFAGGFGAATTLSAVVQID